MGAWKIGPVPTPQVGLLLQPLGLTQMGLVVLEEITGPSKFEPQIIMRSLLRTGPPKVSLPPNWMSPHVLLLRAGLPYA
jgi:hypothetical protein